MDLRATRLVLRAAAWRAKRRNGSVRRDLDLVRGQFDAAFYLAMQADVAASGIDPAEHFLRFGWREGRDPSPRFSVRRYLEANPDVSTAGVNPFVHYLRSGRDEKRTCADSDDRAGFEAVARAFDRAWYLAGFPDEETPADPFLHYMTQGWKEGRDPAPWFSTRYYLAAHPDVRRAGHNPFVHFLRHGRAAGRDALPPRGDDDPATGEGAERPFRVLVVGQGPLPFRVGRLLRATFGVEAMIGRLGPAPDPLPGAPPSLALDPGDPSALAALGAEGWSRVLLCGPAAEPAAAALTRAGIRTATLGLGLLDLAAEPGHAQGPLPGSTSAGPEPSGASVAQVLGAIAARPSDTLPEVPDPSTRSRARAALRLPAEGPLVLGIGPADLANGIDRFLAEALACCRGDEGAQFLWAGSAPPEVRDWFFGEVTRAGLQDRIRITGHPEPNLAPLLAAADLLFLGSRDGPLPPEALDALASGVPLLRPGEGGTPGALRALLSPPPAERAGAARRLGADLARATRFDDYCFAALQRLDPALARVSVVVPNYRYERYLPSRLESVFRQTHPVLEVIVLDDASPDGSVAVIEEVARAAGRDIRLTVSQTNSGSPFVQWRRGLDQARGDYIWIAEADDLAHPELLARLVSRMRASGAALGFCDSWQMDSDGNRTGRGYKAQLNRIEPGAFDAPFDMPGREFLARFLSVQNVIANVSAVLFRREALAAAIDRAGERLFGLRVAGDWRIYQEICAAGAHVAYEPALLNGHRRHPTSVTHALDVARHRDEVAMMQREAARLVPLEPETLAAQQAYLEAVRHHLDRAGPRRDASPAP